MPKIAMVNKMDRIGADFFAVLEGIKNVLGGNPVAMAAGLAHLKLLRETPDFYAAIRMADAAISNPEAQNSCEAWYIKGQIYQKQFDFEQDKLFQVPPQNPNQEIQSEAAYKAFETWLIADSLDVVESQNNPKRKGKLKYRSDIAKFVYKYKDYASNYGAILFQEGKVEEANRIFADCNSK